MCCSNDTEMIFKSPEPKNTKALCTVCRIINIIRPAAAFLWKLIWQNLICSKAASPGQLECVRLSVWVNESRSGCKSTGLSLVCSLRTLRGRSTTSFGAHRTDRTATRGSAHLPELWWPARGPVWEHTVSPSANQSGPCETEGGRPLVSLTTPQVLVRRHFGAGFPAVEVLLYPSTLDV